MILSPGGLNRAQYRDRVCEKLLPLGDDAWSSVMIMDRKGNRENVGIVHATQEGFKWYISDPWETRLAGYKNKDDMVYEYFEGESGDGPLVLRLRKHNVQVTQFAVSVNNLQQALFDRGIEMKCYDNKDDSHYEIAIWYIPI